MPENNRSRNDPNTTNPNQYNFLKIDSLLDDNGIIRTVLINDIGDNNAKYLAEILSQKLEDKKDKQIEKNQIRKFYDNFLRIYNSNVDEGTKKVMLLMQKAHTEYSEKRLNIRRFKIFYTSRLDSVISKNGSDFQKNLDALKLHLEAVIGYFPK
ncbi:MAG TPA: type III-A CRISPR-associated protein Csm2 [Ignavibacteria bacterium]|nr:type III-A CRISPR-associated protein Csm2 [Ignavibacteria bacterium]HRK00459.1 type III-A CRISPR-associated protein Csm2 [Ignavibacteria bacterium]